MTDQSVTERKRDAILDAARAVFSRQGYASAAMDDVAAEAGIAKGTLYLYFRSKEDLYVASLVRDMREFSTKTFEQMDHVPTFRAKLETMLHARLEYMRAHEDFLRIYMAEYGGMFVKKHLNQELCRLYRGNLLRLSEVIQKAIDAGEIRPVPAAALAGAISDISRGLLERRLLEWKEFQVRDEVEFAVDLLWQGIGPERRSGKKA
jgi:AcrR family transcriptional regulator